MKRHGKKKTGNMIFFFVITAFLVFIIFKSNLAGDDGDGLPSGNNEKAFFSAYESVYLKPNGAVISGGSCSGGGIGCGTEVTSEAVARISLYAADNDNMDLLNRELNYYYTVMKHPTTNWMRWKMNLDGSVGSGGGENDATDADLIMIHALSVADKLHKDGKDSSGIKYSDTALLLMNALRGSVIQGKYVGDCQYVSGSVGLPCSDKVFLGYIDLVALKYMCGRDVFWCGVYNQSKNLMIHGMNGIGSYSTYYTNSHTYSFENADIHPNWAIKHLAEDAEADSWAAVSGFYVQTRDQFLTNRAAGSSRICQEFSPVTGCKLSDPPWRVYAHWLEIASVRVIEDTEPKDVQFRDELIKVLEEKRMYSQWVVNGTHLMNNDNFGNIVILEAYADARRSGGVVG